MSKTFGNDVYEELQYGALWELKLVVFVRIGLEVNFLESDACPCGGPGQNLGNKGAVAVSFWIGPTSFCFIGAHFAAHEGEAKRKLRNANYQKIMQELQLGLRNFPLATQFDHIVFCGDLNYRLVEFDDSCLTALRNENVGVLLEHDELAREIEERRTLVGFREGPITFLPTFKLQSTAEPPSAEPAGLDVLPVASSPSYNMLRTPSYTDRVLWRSNITQRPMRCLVYDASFETARYGESDHVPVWGVFTCAYEPPIPPTLEDNQGPTLFILISSLVVKLKGNWPPSPELLATPLFVQSAVIIFQSPCLVNAPVEAFVPVKHFNTKIDPTFTGACAITCLHGLSLDRISKDKLFCTVSTKSDAAPQTILGCGVLRFSKALINSSGTPVPFEMELYNREAITPVGVCVGFITCQIIQ